jgi:hypothetical protein
MLLLLHVMFVGTIYKKVLFLNFLSRKKQCQITKLGKYFKDRFQKILKIIKKYFVYLLAKLS